MHTISAEYIYNTVRNATNIIIELKGCRVNIDSTSTIIKRKGQKSGLRMAIGQSVQNVISRLGDVEIQ